MVRTTGIKSNRIITQDDTANFTIDPVKIQRLMNTPLEALDKALAERHLAEFIKQHWIFIDPHDYVHGWHLDAICEHMEAVFAGEILRLMINIPPRHMKSLGISVSYPAWVWTKKPETQFITFSYASTLTIRDGVKCRRIIDSPLYQSRWGHKYHLTGDQNTKIRFDNDKGGYRINTSIDGVGTGEGGDVIIIDDANNVAEAESEITRVGTNIWFDETLQSRFNDPKTGALVSIQQRTHYDDLSGHIMDKYGKDYVGLILPAEYEVESKRKMALRTFHGWRGDPRTEEGELLWPERFGKKEIDKLKIALGPYAAAGQLQQRPSPREGGLIPLTKFQRYSVMPAIETWKRLSLVFDTAQKEKELNDYSVCQAWVETSRGLFLLFIWRKKCRYPELRRNAKSLCEEWKPHEVLIEDKSSGSSLIQDLQEYKKFPIIGIDPKNIDKTMRMETEATAIEAGLVWIPETAGGEINLEHSVKQCLWLTDFEEECAQFPMGQHDDQIDPMSMYLKRVRERRQKQPPVVAPLIDDFSGESHWR